MQTFPASIIEKSPTQSSLACSPRCAAVTWLPNSLSSILRGCTSHNCATIPVVTAGDERVTKVTFTAVRAAPTIHFVVWQFWGRAAGRPELKSSGRFFLSRGFTVAEPSRSLWLFSLNNPSVRLKGRNNKPRNRFRNETPRRPFATSPAAMHPIRCYDTCSQFG